MISSGQKLIIFHFFRSTFEFSGKIIALLLLNPVHVAQRLNRDTLFTPLVHQAHVGRKFSHIHFMAPYRQTPHFYFPVNNSGTLPFLA